MWCSSATIPILAVVIVSGVCYQGSSSSAFPTSASERVAAQSFHRESNVAVVTVVAVIVSVIAATAVAVAVAVAVAAVVAAAVAVAGATHARVIAPSTCRVIDDSIRRVCWPRLFTG